jgi:hypothetical protein
VLQAVSAVIHSASRYASVDSFFPSDWPAIINDSPEKDREILVLFDVLSLGPRSPIRESLRRVVQRGARDSHDELLINSLKTAFVWGTPA